MNPIVCVYCDGASKGNPGPASIGAVCFKGQPQNLTEFKQAPQALFQISKAIGQKTNNEAEYLSLIESLEKLNQEEIKEAEIYMDSELVVRQVNGQYKVKNERLKPLYLRVKELCSGNRYRFTHVRRENNQIADYLANQALTLANRN